MNPEAVLTVDVLGPVRAARDGTDVDLGRAGQRAVLGLLALAGGRPLTRAELVDALWGDAPPPTAANVLQTSVKNLRHRLEPDRLPRSPSTVLPSVGDGYALSVPAERVDLMRFRALVAEATDLHQAGDHRGAARTLGAALGLWRGVPLADVAALAGHPKIVAVVEERRAALAGYGQALIASGAAAEALAPLEAAVAEQPLDEAAHARLILGYHAAGRRGQAFTAYRAVRRRLADELGVDPGPELTAAFATVLGGDTGEPVRTGGRHPEPAAHPVPAQLPAGSGAFTGRSQQLRRLAELAGGPPSAGMPLVVLSGTAGVGKTTLAVHFGQQVRHRFPDGQLYVNLRGFDPGGTVMDPADAVRGFLDAFGIPPERLPAGLDALTALFRSVLADRRVLVVLDNARDAEQVRPLLPGSAGCLVLVTSRSRLTSLVATDDAQPVTLDVPSLADARALLARRLGRARTAAAPEAVDELIGLCSRLPLALAVMAARAATQPDFPLTALARQLREESGSLDALADDDPATDVRAVFSWSYRVLGPEAARLFRLSGLAPGPELTAEAAASLAGVSLARARVLLRTLVGAHLMTESLSGRYGCHDLLRWYATELTHAVDPPEERRAAQHRLLDHWVRTAHAADRLLNPHRERAPTVDVNAEVTVTRLADRDAAMAWLAGERPMLLAAVDLAEAEDFAGHTWRLAWALMTYLHRSGHWDALVATQRAGLRAAERLGDRWVRATAHRGLARAYIQVRRPGAVGHLGQALRLYREVQDSDGQARTHLNLAWICQGFGRERAALGHAEQAVFLFRAAGQPVGEADARNAVGWFHAHLGNPGLALEWCRQALPLHQRIGDEDGEAHTWDSLGYIHNLLGDRDEAIACYRQAVRIRRVLGDRVYEASALHRIGDLESARGDVAGAHDAWREALDCLAPLRHPEADEIRAKLAAPPGDAAG
ncbi:SARP family transcriptional regulator [Actinoplanes sp. NBRC 14428]|nr:SARP family transcriptional regulator [Actinoplanes sp. NBRC 14428]